MKRTALLLFSVIMSTIMMAQRKETTILEVSGNLATPLTVHTSKGTYTLYDSMELNGSVSVRSAEDANGDKVVVPSGDYKSHTSNGKSEYTRIYRFKTMYNRSSSSSSNSSRSYGGGNYGGSSYGGGYSSSSNMPYEHLRDVARTSNSIYGTWYRHKEVYNLNFKEEFLVKITKDQIICKIEGYNDGEYYHTTNVWNIINADGASIEAEYFAPRDYQTYSGDRKNGRIISYDETIIKYHIQLVNGILKITYDIVPSFYDRNGSFICKETVLSTRTPEEYLSVPDQF